MDREKTGFTTKKRSKRGRNEETMLRYSHEPAAADARGPNGGEREPRSYSPGDAWEHLFLRSSSFTPFLRVELRYLRYLRYPPNRVISGAPPAFRSISSRARSDVVEIPWILSLNSSTL